MSLQGSRGKPYKNKNGGIKYHYRCPRRNTGIGIKMEEFNHTCSETDFVKEEKMLKEEIKKFALERPVDNEVERYVDKYTSMYPSNTERMQQVIHSELLPEELAIAFRKDRPCSDAGTGDSYISASGSVDGSELEDGEEGASDIGSLSEDSSGEASGRENFF